MGDSKIPSSTQESSQLGEDVSFEFELIFLLYGIAFLIDTIKDFMSAVMYKNHANWLAKPVFVMSFVIIFYFVIIVLHHIDRLGFGGQVCSGDFLTKEESSDPSNKDIYLDQRGYLLWILLIIIWIVLGCAVLICCFTLYKYLR